MSLTPTDFALFGAVVALALNQVVMRIDRLLLSDLVFYGIVILDMAIGSAILAFGMPGLEEQRAIGWVLGLLFFVHAAQDLGLRQRRMAERAAEADEARRLRAAELASRVREEGEPPAPPPQP